MKLTDIVKEAYDRGSIRGTEMAPPVTARFQQHFADFLDNLISGSLTDIASSFYQTSIYPSTVIIQVAKENPYPYASLRASAFTIGALGAIIKYSMRRETL